MSEFVKIQIEGLADLKAEMTGITAKIQGQVMESAARGGATEIVKMSRKNLPSWYNTLRQSLDKKRIKSRKGYIKWTVGPTVGKNAKHDGWYAHIVENGAQPHEIGPKKGKALSIPGPSNFGNVAVAFRSVKHPGVKATKFMARAFNQHSRILAAVVKSGRRRFDRMRTKGQL